MRNVISSLVLSGLVLGLVALHADGQQPMPKGAPPEATVKKLLEVQWGPLGASTKHVYNFKSIQYAAPKREVINVNGVGVETGKLRYPVRVVCDIRVMFNDGTSRMETKNQTFDFFLDEFQAWSFRFMQNN